MTDDEWKQKRDRSILAAFQTGRPVFADSDGVLRYADGDCEPLSDDVGRSGRVVIDDIDDSVVHRSWLGRLFDRIRGRS